MRMQIFDKLSSGISSKNTTKNFYLGSAEAEAETVENSEVYLLDVFEDYFNIFEGLKSVRFIVLGRKGTGKSAIGRVLYSFAANNQGGEANFFCDFVKHGDIQLEQVVQIAEKNSSQITYRFLYEWIILIKLINLLLQNQSLLDENESRLLEKFLNKNSGFTSIDQQKAKEYIEKNSSNVDVTYLKRFFKIAFQKELSTSKEKAPFYELLPDLQKVVVELLKKDKNSANRSDYLLIFDDLDIDFDLNSKEKLLATIDLLRTTKDYNTEVFGNVQAKIILLMRDDIASELVKHAAKQSIPMPDISKLFKSYALEPLVWYEHDKYKYDENDLAIKKFINKRIVYSAKRLNMACNEEDPWSWLIAEDSFSSKQSSFKEILDFTFFRPRDLLLFFRTLPTYSFQIPLQYKNIESLKKKYLKDFMEEIESELSTTYPGDIQKIRQALAQCAGGSFDYSFFEAKMIDTGFRGDIAKLAEVLFNYSYIGHLIDGKEVHFKHRERENNQEAFNISEPLILHKAIEEYFKYYKS